MIVAYFTADFEAVSNMLSDPDKFVKADPFPFLLTALIIYAFGPGEFSMDALLKRRGNTVVRHRDAGTSAAMESPPKIG
jgi:putative oxidoreductase